MKEVYLAPVAVGCGLCLLAGVRGMKCVPGVWRIYSLETQKDSRAHANNEQRAPDQASLSPFPAMDCFACLLGAGYIGRDHVFLLVEPGQSQSVRFKKPLQWHERVNDYFSGPAEGAGASDAE